MSDDALERTPRETANELLSRIALGDPERVADLYAEEVDWKLGWPMDVRARDVPWIRHRSDRAGVAAHFTEIGRRHRPAGEGTSIETIIADGPHVVITGVIRNEVLATGKMYAARFALHLRVADGLIVQHHVYEDSLAIRDAVVDEVHDEGGPDVPANSVAQAQ